MCVTDGVAVVCGPGHRLSEVQATWVIGEVHRNLSALAAWAPPLVVALAFVVLAAGVVVGRALTAVK